MDLKGRTALITGASSGLGVCFAEQLAAAGADLVVTARRKDRLDALAKRLGEEHGVSVRVIELDLAAKGAAARLFEETEGAGSTVDVLVNNAGLAVFAPFTEAPWERTEHMLQVNMMALTELTWRFAVAMRGRGRGHVLNISSFAGYTPVPHYAAYAATKTYVRNFTEAVAHELSGSGVRVCCLCPGAVATEFWEVAGQKTRPFVVRITMAEPDKVARTGLRALFRGRRNIIHGFLNKLTAFFMRLMPRRLLVGVTGRTLAGGKKKG